MTIPLVNIFDPAPHTVEYLGGKGFGLVEMQKAGINVPPAIIIPTEVCRDYMKDPVGTMAAVKGSLVAVQDFFIDQFGFMPLVSVRSGARVSMPGMMDTVLNVGLDPVTYPFWKDKLGEDCVENCYDRLHEMYGATVLGMKDGKHADLPLAADQLLGAIEAVFKSWNSERAIEYRKQFNIPDDWGTAVTIQAMVFGNFNANSGSGVLLTRNVDTGEDDFMLNFAANAQGEDVVAGKVAGMTLDQMIEWNQKVSSELGDIAMKLEKEAKDAMDIEFTVQDGKLYILQKRVAKRNSQAAVKIALDFYKEGVIDKQTLFMRIKRRDFDLSQLPVLDPAFKDKPLFTGVGASSGIATGVVVHSAEAAINCQVPCILVTKETNPDDFGGMVKAAGVLTMEGGYTSHAALVARSLNKPCVVGLGGNVDGFLPGTVISIDGATGRVWDGAVPVIEGGKSDTLKELLGVMWGAVGASEIGADYLTLEGHYTDTPEAAANYLMVKALESGLGQVYLDIRYPAASKEEMAFYSCFMDEGSLYESPIIQALQSHIVKQGWSKDWFILVCQSTPFAESCGFKAVPAVSGLESLVLAEGDVIMQLPQKKSAAVKKVLDWQKGKLTQMAVGEVIPKAKSFITESDLVVKLLG